MPVSITKLFSVAISLFIEDDTYVELTSKTMLSVCLLFFSVSVVYLVYISKSLLLLFLSLLSSENK